MSVNLLLAIGLVYALAWMTFRWLASYTRHDVYIKIPDLSSLDLKQALLLLEREGLEYNVDTTRYDPVFEPYKIFVYAPEVGDHVKPGRHIFIRANAGGFKPIPLPEVVQTNERIARTRLSESNILIGQVTYVPDIVKGIVLKVLHAGHEIQSGTMLPYQAKVDLLIGRGYTKDIPVPDLTEMDLTSAKELLQAKNFLLGEVMYDSSENTQNPRIYRQDPAPGQIYDEGKPLNLWLADVPQSQFDSLVLRYKPKKEIPVTVSPSVSKEEKSSASVTKEPVDPELEVPLDEGIIFE
ncbi:PASTA domain-containing protein [Bacteroidetes bacterium endosymbiont of Geopemphigus sp.]|uniref:PASTA domain-containing protein n=1 Tax=Bacteroidetes bacterium endosymbiont of Geopemphigus sp. TaxID=2047937 RepID=UPI0018A87709|nr:PASTA domain-containing protein [Bacteroidetes bacterium endosymbiont of Geopemphigus sp.]